MSNPTQEQIEKIIKHLNDRNYHIYTEVETSKVIKLAWKQALRSQDCETYVEGRNDGIAEERNNIRKFISQAIEKAETDARDEERKRILNLLKQNREIRGDWEVVGYEDMKAQINSEDKLISPSSFVKDIDKLKVKSLEEKGK